jgi:hypothetical protein
LALTNTMTYPTELKTMQLRQSMRPAALRRNLGTAVIVAVAFSGGPFGLTWLATSSATTFVVLVLWRLKQQQMMDGNGNFDIAQVTQPGNPSGMTSNLIDGYMA